ncbi:MAG: YqaA family protein [Paracoccaceae bacterium]
MATANDHAEPTDEGWTAHLAHHRTGLAALSFAESTVVPLPLETLVIPLMIGHPKRSMVIATAIWLGCLVGAATFYLIGLWIADPIVRPALDALGLSEAFNQMLERLNTEGLFWTVFLVSLLPAPMQLATLGAGAAGGNFAVFLAAIALSRGLRYFGLAIIAQYAGKRIAHWGLPKRYVVPGLLIILLGSWALYQLL